jgi:putative transcriptional regulator
LGRKNKHKHGEAATRSSTNSIDLRTLELPSRPKPLKPADIRVLRVRLNASQALLARLLNVSSNTVESWEQGIRKPRQATLKLLHIARKNPSVLLFPSPIKRDTDEWTNPNSVLSVEASAEDSLPLKTASCGQHEPSASKVS